MKTTPTLLSLLMTLFLSAYLLGCGGGNAAQQQQAVVPAPTISSLSPPGATAGGPQFTLTVTGTNFVAGAVVTWNGSNRATTFVSSTQLSATILASDIASSGNANVSVVNPAPSGLSSNAMAFVINAAPAPAPTISSLSPPSATVGGPNFTLTVNGTGFVQGSVVTWNGNNRLTTFMSSTQLSAAILASDIATAGTANVAVLNPPNSLPSNVMLFAINAAKSGPTFTLTGTMTTPRVFHTATLLPNGMVLLVGGFDANVTEVSSAELYDPSSGTFTPTGTMTTARDSHTATLLPGGKVLIAGGFDGSAGSSTAELYDPSTGTFTPTGSMAEGRSRHTATLLPNGKVLIAGGFATGDWIPQLASAELYDPATGVFTPTGSMSVQRGGHIGVLLPNSKVLIASGVGANGLDPIASAELYEPFTGTFTPTASMESVRYEATATLLPNGKVLIAGGEIATAELYDPPSGTFAPTGSMAVDRVFFTATLLANGEVLIAGEFDDINAELYDPSTGNFSFTGSMVVARDGLTATLLLNGSVLVTGGRIENSVTDAAELYQQGSAPSVAVGALTPGSQIRRMQLRVCPSGVRMKTTTAVQTGGCGRSPN